MHLATSSRLLLHLIVLEFYIRNRLRLRFVMNEESINHRIVICKNESPKKNEKWENSKNKITKLIAQEAAAINIVPGSMKYKAVEVWHIRLQVVEVHQYGYVHER